jgi:hypothetical protein
MYAGNYASRAAAGAYLKVPISYQRKPGIAGSNEDEMLLIMEAEPGIEPRSTALQEVVFNFYSIRYE